MNPTERYAALVFVESMSVFKDNRIFALVSVGVVSELHTANCILHLHALTRLFYNAEHSLTQVKRESFHVANLNQKIIIHALCFTYRISFQYIILIKILYFPERSIDEKLKPLTCNKKHNQSQHM